MNKHFFKENDEIQIYLRALRYHFTRVHLLGLLLCVIWHEGPASLLNLNILKNFFTFVNVRFSSFY